MTPRRVIRSYMLIAAIYTLSASLIWGVNTLFLLKAGLTIAEVFIANAAFTAGMVIFEIPTGVLADTAGRRASFLLSVLVLSASTLAYLAVSETGGGVLAFSIISIFLGLGFTFYSGAVEAWLVDALKATDYQGDLDAVFSRGAMVTGAAMLIGSISGGFLGSVDLALPFIGRALLLLVSFVIAYFTMHDLGYTPRALKLARIPAEMRAVADASVTYGWRQPNLRLLMIAGAIQGGFMMWAFYAWQPYFLALFGDPGAVYIAGIITALLSLSTIAGNWLVERLTRHCGKRTTIMIGAMVVFVICMTGVGLTSSFYLAVTLFLIAMGTTGVSQPVRQSYIHHLAPSEQRATIVSVDSMFASGGAIVSQIGLGQVAQTGGIAQGYVIGGVASALCLPLLLVLRGRPSPADNIVGRASHQGGQAGQGLPANTQVDCTPQHPVADGSAGT
ncbi:MAG: MFS transporter [Anaerolineae bacterium]|nr:MFS transporter [Anaerolineae bacterium]